MIFAVTDLTESEENRIRKFAEEIYERRLLTNKHGDSQRDWKQAEEIVRSTWRKLLFRANRPILWFLYTLPEHKWIKMLTVPLLVTVSATLAGSIITSQIQREANQNAILKEYFEQLETLTFEHNLLADTPDVGAIVLARGRTVAALRELDWKRRKQLIQFLQASDLSRFEENKEESVISLKNQNLSNINLHNIDLKEIDFRGANLSNANFQRAFLRGANLQDADLAGANLQDADLAGANLQDAILQRANLQDAFLRDANFQNAVLQRVNLQDADLWDANLQDAVLGKANLQDTFLRGADLQDVDLWEANLQRAILRDANLRGAFLGNANLKGALLRDTNLQEAILRDANLQGAILLATNLNNVQSLQIEQLEGELPPFLCNVNLPSQIEDIDSNRDCSVLPSTLVKRYDQSLKATEAMVREAEKKQWD